MSTNSAIEWTTHTFNPWWGCTKVHDGCKHCYAETLDHRWGGDHWGPRASRRMIVGEWSKPAQWNREAQAKGERARVFCASMCDLFEAFTGHVVDQQDRRVPMPAPMLAKYGHLADGGNWTVVALRARVFDIIAETPWLTWLLLTKRPENIVGMVPPRWLEEWPLRNVWIGTSVENQKTADERIPHLLRCPAAVRFLSVEPLLGPVNLGSDSTGGCDALPVYRQAETISVRSMPSGRPLGTLTNQPPWSRHDCTLAKDGSKRGFVDWVIVGGESGANARPCDVAWIRSVVAQCRAAGVPCFVKQLGARPIAHSMPIGNVPLHRPEGGPLKDKKGGTMEEWPADLRVREMPESKETQR